eukprot:SAG11_NODE_1846_length_4172_cov_3.188313_2_plen_88_part_00
MCFRKIPGLVCPGVPLRVPLRVQMVMSYAAVRPHFPPRTHQVSVHILVCPGSASVSIPAHAAGATDYPVAHHPRHPWRGFQPLSLTI